MSVVPLRISEGAKATRKPRDPRGTVNIAYGYRLSQQKQTHPKVHSTTTKQTRSPVAGPRTKYAAKEAREPLKGKDPTANDEQRESVAPRDSAIKNEQGGSIRARSSSRIERGISLQANVPVNAKESHAGSKDLVNPKKDASLVHVTDPGHEDKRRSIRNAKYSRKEENHISILPVNFDLEKNELKAEEERELSSFLRTKEFVEITDKRILKKKIRSLIDEGLTEYEQSINARREKLRSLLLAEEKSLIREVVEQAQRGADLRAEEMRKRVEELRKLKEEKRLATVKEKRMRQYLDQCPELRDRIAKETTLETKYSNLGQMAENEAKRQAEKEVDMLWYELMLKEVEAKRARELEEARRRFEDGKVLVATLAMQVAGKQASDDEKTKMKEEDRENPETFEVGEPPDPAKEREKREKLKKDLDEQASTARRYLADRAREEEALDNALRILNEAELAREQAISKESVLRLRDEIAAYMASVEEFRREKMRRNAEIEEIVAATAREVEKRRDLAKAKSREEQKRKLRGVLEGREQQLREKRVVEEEKNKRSILDDELRRKETETEASLEAQAEMRRRENALRYGQELKAQQKYAEEMRRRENEKIERMLRDNLEQEKEYETLAEQMLNAPEIITPHAFKIMLQECAARREAKQKALCYSSRSLAQLQPASSTGHP